MAVNISLFAGAGWQFFDNSGVPLAGGLLYSYEAGTTTPAATYTTSAGTIANTNPIVLDAAGRPPSEVWLSANTLYKFVVKTSTGTLIRTYDNIPGANDSTTLDNFIVALANTSNIAQGDALVGFKQANASGILTGAVGKTVHDKLTEFVSVKDFGAVGNGITNDTTAIQTAIDTLTSNGGGTLNVPTGTYLIDTINVKSNIYILCADGVTFNKTPGTLSDDNNAFNFYGTESATTSNLTANVSIGALSVVVTSAAGFSENDWCLLRDNVYISGSEGRNQEIVQIKTIVGTTISLYANTIGAYTTAQAVQLVKILPVENATLDGGEIIVPIGTTNGGGITTNLCVNSTIKNCSIYNAQDNASIDVTRSYNIDITGVSCFNGQNLSSGGYGYAFSIGESSHHIRVTNNHQQSVRESSITNRARFVVFANNTGLYSFDNFVNTHGSGCENIVIANNASSGGNAGITVGFGTHTAGDKNVLVTGNVISDTNGGGISVSGLVGKEHSNVVISNNIISNPCLSISTQCLNFGFVIGGTCVNNYIDGNNSANATYGIISTGCTNINIRNNSVINLSAGFGIYNNLSDNVVISENTVRNVLSFNYRVLSTTKNAYVSNNYSDDALIQIQGYLVTAGAFVVARQYKIVSVGTTDFTLIGATANTVGLYFVATGVGIGTGTADSVPESPNVVGNTAQTFTGVATYDPANITDGDGVTTTLTVTGVTLGGYALATFSLNLQGIILSAWVSATNTVSVRFQNETGGAIDLASGTLRVQVANIFN